MAEAPFYDCRSETSFSEGHSSQKKQFWENKINMIEKKKGNLASQKRQMEEKVLLMEKTLPAMLAFKMCMANGNCENFDSRVQEMMNTLMPGAEDPTEKLLERLKSQTDKINKELEELHEKIIINDMKFEEIDAEIEASQQRRQEICCRIDELQKQLDINSSPSLHSIHSEDLPCIDMICQLASEEKRLKASIRELESKEKFYREQMHLILQSRNNNKCSRHTAGCEKCKENHGRGKLSSDECQQNARKVKRCKARCATQGQQKVADADNKSCSSQRTQLRPSRTRTDCIPKQVSQNPQQCPEHSNQKHHSGHKSCDKPKAPKNCGHLSKSQTRATTAARCEREIEIDDSSNDGETFCECCDCLEFH